jgi:hypothetical protein
MRADGSEATPLVVGVNLPDISPTGEFFAAPSGVGQRTGRDLGIFRMSDGSRVASAIPLRASPVAPLGRSRWVGPRRVAYSDRDDDGNFGVAVRDITDTEIGPPRKLAGFDPLLPTESFAVTPDAARMILSVRNSVLSIAVAENVSGIDVSGEGR